MALPYEVINDYEAALNAGFDSFFLRPVINEVDSESKLVDISSVKGGSGGSITEVTLDFAQMVSQRKAYEKFVDRVLSAVVEGIYYLVDIQTRGEIPRKGEKLGYLDLPDGVAASELILTGTIAQVNQVLKKIYYFAPNMTNGDVMMLIEVRDTPHYDCIRVPKPLTVSTPLYTHYLSGSSDNINETLSIESSCSSVDSTKGFAIGYANRTIPIRVMHMNQPPEVRLSPISNFSIPVDAILSNLGISVSDDDNDDVEGYTSFGHKVSAPISVTLSTIHGKLTLPNRDHLSLFHGRGILDTHISFRGELSAVNTALLELQYICRKMEGCGPHYSDHITIYVNDGGFFGRGGPMSDTKVISVFLEE